jgi:hypothetical protein
MNMKARTPRIAALLAIALVNVFGLINSGRLQDIRTIDTLRLVATGVLIGVAIGLLRPNRAPVR